MTKVTGVVVERTEEMVVPVRPAPPRPRSRRGFPAMRLAGRLARREVRRRPGRTALVALMVAVPVAGMVVAAVYTRTDPLGAENEWRQRYGAADFAGEVPAGGTPGVDAPHAHVVVFRTAERRLRTATGGDAAALVTDLPVNDPLTAGMLVVREGRRPAGQGEVLLSPDLATRLGVGLGDHLHLVEPATVDAAVVGLGTLADAPARAALVAGPVPTILGPDSRGVAPVSRMLVGLSGQPLPFEYGYWVGQRGLAPSPRIVGLDTAADGGNRLLLTWIIGAVALSAAGIVIASAFAISGRRQLVTVGLLGANGAPAPVVRAVLLLQGAITGAAGTLAGIALGAGLLIAGRPHLDRIWAAPPDTYRWQAVDLVPIVVLGLLVSTVAAAVPARTIGRVPVRVALAGRWPLTVVPERLTDVGVGAVTIGTGLLAAGIASAAPGGATPSGTGFVTWIAVGSIGALCVLLGMGALTPLLVAQLERLAGRLSGRWRLAARSLARRRAHTAALVAAVCASAALSLAASSYAVGARGEMWSGAKTTEIPLDQVRIGAVVDGRRAPVPESVVQQVRAALPDATVTRLTATGPERPGAPAAARLVRPDDGTGGPPVWWTGSRLATTRRPVVADEPALSAYGLSPWAREKLRQTGAIAAEGTAGPALIPELEGKVPVAIVPAGDAPGLDTVLIEPEWINRLRFLTEPGPVVLRSAGPLDDDAQARLRALGWPFAVAGPTAAGSAGADHATADFTDGRDLRPMVLAEVGLAAGSVLVTLGVIAVGLSLAGAETRRERELLLVNGAPPRTIAGVNGRKAALVVLIGSLLAVPVGLLPAWASLDAAGRQHAFAVPWRTVGLLVVVVPVVAGMGAGAASALALRRRPVAISTMAVD